MKTANLPLLVVLIYSLSINGQESLSQDRWLRRPNTNDEDRVLPNRFRRRPFGDETHSGGRFRASFLNRRPINEEIRNPEQNGNPEEIRRTIPDRNEFPHRSPVKDSKWDDFDNSEAPKFDRSDLFTEPVLSDHERQSSKPNFSESSPQIEQDKFDFSRQAEQNNPIDFRMRPEQGNFNFRPQAEQTNPIEFRAQPEQGNIDFRPSTEQTDPVQIKSQSEQTDLTNFQSRPDGEFANNNPPQFLPSEPQLDEWSNPNGEQQGFNDFTISKQRSEEFDFPGQGGNPNDRTVMNDNTLGSDHLNTPNKVSTIPNPNHDDLLSQRNTDESEFSPECVILELEHGPVCVDRSLFGSLS